MAAKVDLYNNAYAKTGHEVYRQIRTETYGHDLGQTSWVSAEESALIPELLKLASGAAVLEIGSGSGLYAIELARRVGCSVTGLDLNEHGIVTANQLSASAGMEMLVRFQQCDVSKPLSFAEETFDAAFANDVLCHVAERASVLKELFRVLRPGARLLFSDALVIGGMISNTEIATRSSIGPYFFSPPGKNERLLESAGFEMLSVTDTSEQAAALARRWRDAREGHREELIPLEGAERFGGLQQFLACVQALTSERRLLRYVYLAEKTRPG